MNYTDYTLKIKMKIFSVFILSTIILVSHGTDIKSIVKSNGYTIEEHSIETEDGYILTLFRIPYGKNGTETNSKPVLLHPGLGASADVYLSLGPEKGLGYILADQQFDVWLLSPRGTTYSKKNIYIDEKLNKKEFYDFSWHEIGIYDNPCAIDYILNRTGEENLYYIGHSQGSTSFLVMASERPEYNDKIRLATLLAPVAFLEKVNPIMKLASLKTDIIADLTQVLQIYDIPFIDQIRKLLKTVCGNSVFFPICNLLYDFAVGYSDADQLDTAIYSQIFEFSPSDAAIKQFLHFSQIIKARGKFLKYDYGSSQNLKIYNSVYPPEYSLTNVKSKVALYVGKNDQYAGVKNSEKLKKKLSNVVRYSVINYDKWNHGDFIFGTEVVKYVYEEVIKVMNKC